ncbi:hypothetical protein HDK90DRAFT_526641 [Phyllosticta capitalensis]|uniref:Nephrocystin 3-like N-terminal domain-containing protein n=1 Tax=Phyllosticta capitalensis TaxID=121624 RepID=A0ABR1YL70_9PEZI
MANTYKINQSSTQGVTNGRMDNHGTVYGYVENVYNHAPEASSAGQENPKVRKIMEWVAPQDFSRVPAWVSEETLKGTCQWFLDSKEFKSWKSRATRNLWVHGKRISIVIDDLKNTGETRQVASLYLLYKQQPLVKDLIGNLASQLLSNFIKSSELPSCVQSLWDQENRKRSPFEDPPTISQLEDLLSALGTNDTFLVIDALDEFDSSKHEEFLTRLSEIPDVSLLITSRAKAAEEFETVYITADIRDMHRYIDNAIRFSNLKNRLKQDPRLEAVIKQEVVERADGIFLLVRLHMNALAACLTPSEARNTLKQLPSDRDEMYQVTLQRIQKQKRKGDWAITTIGWIVHAGGRLKVEELRHALLIGGPVGHPLELGDARFDHGNLLSDDDILACCCGLVETEGYWDKTLRFIHYTTQEFFDANREKLFPQFQSRISLACAKYLCLPRLAEQNPDLAFASFKMDPDLSIKVSEFFFALESKGVTVSELKDYYSNGFDFEGFEAKLKEHGWGFWQRSHPNSLALEKILYTNSTLCDGPNDYTEELREFQRLEKDGRFLYKSDSYIRRCKSYFNGQGVLKHLNADLKQLLYPFVVYAGFNLKHHFLAAYDDECCSIVEDQIDRLLQNKGSRYTHYKHVRQEDHWSFGQSLFREKIDQVAYIGSRRLFEQYLDIGDVDISDTSLPERGRAWLELASRNECSDVVKAIISSGDIVKLTSFDGHSLLQKAAQIGYSREVIEVIDKICRHLVILEQNENSKSWMTQAKGWLTGDSYQPRLATNHFEDVNPIQLSAHIRLLSSSSTGDLEMVSELLDRSHVVLTNIAEGDIISTTKSYLVKTSFLLAIESNHAQIVDKFLEHGMDVNFQEFWTGATPLHRACFNNYEEIVKLLLRNNARTDVKGRNADHVWKTAKSLRVVQLLVEATQKSPSALAYAAGVLVLLIRSGRSPELVYFLLEAGLDPSIPDGSGNTALNSAVLCEDVYYTKTLLQHRACPNEIFRGRTLLDRATNNLEKRLQRSDPSGFVKRSRKIVELLKAHGAKTIEELKSN